MELTTASKQFQAWYGENRERIVDLLHDAGWTSRVGLPELMRPPDGNAGFYLSMDPANPHTLAVLKELVAEYPDLLANGGVQLP